MKSQKATFEKTTDNKIIIRVDERILVSDSITEGERQNLKNRRTEILITNYQQQPNLFDF